MKLKDKKVPVNVKTKKKAIRDAVVEALAKLGYKEDKVQGMDLFDHDYVPEPFREVTDSPNTRLIYVSVRRPNLIGGIQLVMFSSYSSEETFSNLVLPEKLNSVIKNAVIEGLMFSRVKSVFSPDADLHSTIKIHVINGNRMSYLTDIGTLEYRYYRPIDLYRDDAETINKRLRKDVDIYIDQFRFDDDENDIHDAILLYDDESVINPGTKDMFQKCIQWTPEMTVNRKLFIPSVLTDRMTTATFSAIQSFIINRFHGPYAITPRTYKEQYKALAKAIYDTVEDHTDSKTWLTEYLAENKLPLIVDGILNPHYESADTDGILKEGCEINIKSPSVYGW